MHAKKPHSAVRQRRKMLGLTQGELAERLGVHKRTIRRYETGDADVPPAVLLAMNAMQPEEKSK